MVKEYMWFVDNMFAPTENCSHVFAQMLWIEERRREDHSADREKGYHIYIFLFYYIIVEYKASCMFSIHHSRHDFFSTVKVDSL